MLAELRAADFVVDVTNYWGENVDESMLEELGFEPAARIPARCRVLPDLAAKRGRSRRPRQSNGSVGNEGTDRGPVAALDDHDRPVGGSTEIV